MMRPVLRLASLTAALFLAACAITIDQNKLYRRDMAQPRDAVLTAPPGYRLDERLLELPGLGHLHAVLLDNPDTQAVIIFNGGRSNFVALQTVRMRRLAQATGMDIILYDYAGRGGTDIEMTTDNALATGPAMLGKMREIGWIGEGPLFAYGFSFGGSQAAALVRNGGFDGIIIEGSTPDVERIGRDLLPGVAKPFVRVRVDEEIRRFDYLAYVRAAKTPVLLISNTGDKVVRPARMDDFHARLKADGVNARIIHVPGKHGGGLENTEVQDAINAFVKEAMNGNAERPSSGP